MSAGNSGNANLNNDSAQPQASDLVAIRAKILAIGELISFKGGEPSLDEEVVNYGIGLLLTEIANQLADLILGLYKPGIIFY